MSRQGTIRRYTLIIEKINRNKFPSLTKIQEYLNSFGFSIVKRTLERDISAIRNEFGLEICYNRSKEGYYIDFENSINTETFLRFLEIVNTAELLTETLREGKNALEHISFENSTDMKGIEYLKPLLQAIKEHRKITFNHFNYKTEKSRNYRMEPYHLKEYQSRWYIIGVVDEISDIWTFGLDRITNLEVLDELFTPREEINPRLKFSNSIGIGHTSKNIQYITLAFTPNQGHYVKGLPLHKSQKVLKDDSNECIIQLYINTNYELIQQILKYNDQVKVLEPQWLVEEIKNILQRTLNQYK